MNPSHPSGKKIGYIRVSSYDQNPQRQLEGLDLDRCFIDHASGKSLQRPQLQNLLDYIRDGDTVIVHSLDRLARNLDDLRTLVKQMTDKHAQLQFLKEKLAFTGEDTPLSHLLLSVMGAFAEFERSLIRERQLEGIALAKTKGVCKGRKPVYTNSTDIQRLRDRVASGEKKSALARELNVSRTTLDRYLKECG